MITKRYIKILMVICALFPGRAFSQWAAGHGPQKNVNEEDAGNTKSRIYDYTDKEKKDSEKDIIPDDNCHKPERLIIKKGQNETIISGVVTRSGSFCYVLWAKKGQKIEFNQIDSTNNMAMIMFDPGWSYQKLVQGGDIPDGNKVNNLDISEKRSAKAILSKSGDYLIVMTISNGGAGGYKMRIKIK